MGIENLIKRNKKLLRLLDNYFVSNDKKILEVDLFLDQIINFQYGQIKIFNSRDESIFNSLCEDIIKQSNNLKLRIKKEKSFEIISKAKNLLKLFLTINRYIKEINDSPWILGKKVNRHEMSNIRGIFRRKLHSAYNNKNKELVRGTKVKILLTGSLTRGYSDWRLINGGDIPKPVDYGLPREYRKKKSVYKRLDEDLIIPDSLKSKMSDVDILIINEVIYNSIDQNYSYNGWSFRLGEKYPVGVGGSNIITSLHQSLNGTKIGGIRGRWVNYVILKDKKQYGKYLSNRKAEIKKAELKINKKIKIKDIKILDEIIS